MCRWGGGAGRGGRSYLDTAIGPSKNLEAFHGAHAGEGNVGLPLRKHALQRDLDQVQGQALALVDGQRPGQLQGYL